MIDPPAYEENLPLYDCTVFKQGYVKIKQELSIGGIEITKNRSWATVYFILRGTLLEIYKDHKSKYPKYHISMWKAHCGIAADYLRYNNVLRFRSSTKEQFIWRPNDGLAETVSWFEHIQSSINISTDIDKRRMPHIITLAREHCTKLKTVTIVVGKTHAVVPILNNS